jgi:hypothetical protein
MRKKPSLERVSVMTGGGWRAGCHMDCTFVISALAQWLLAKFWLSIPHPPSSR